MNYAARKLLAREAARAAINALAVGDVTEFACHAERYRAFQQIAWTEDEDRENLLNPIFEFARTLRGGS